MKIVSITGSSGFIGTHLIKEINKENFKINVLSRKKIKNSNKKNTFIKFDLDNKYKNCFKKIGSPNILIHLAWGGIPNYTSKYHLHEELKKQYAFLSSCIKNGLENLIITGTCLEYGDISRRMNERMLVKPKIAYAMENFDKEARKELDKVVKKMGWGKKSPPKRVIAIAAICCLPRLLGRDDLSPKYYKLLDDVLAGKCKGKEYSYPLEIQGIDKEFKPKEENFSDVLIDTRV